MKTIALVLMMVGLSVTGAVAQDSGGHKVTVLSEKMDVLYLKVSEAYVGASLVVLDKDGVKVFDTTVSKRKFLVDFFEQKSGDYLVHIEKGGFSQELKYHKT